MSVDKSLDEESPMIAAFPVVCHHCSKKFSADNERPLLTKCPEGHNTYISCPVTLDEITLTPRQTELMEMMLHDTQSAPSTLKALVRYQKWMKLIWEEAKKS